jgi:general secretion pathway protein K
VSELSWYGIEPQIIATLEPYVVILPLRTPVNANTASAQVLMTAADGIDRGTAERIVQARQAKPFQSLDDVKPLMPAAAAPLTTNDIDVHTSWFEVTGQLRYEQHILRQRTLVKRQGLDVNVVRTERLPPDEK